MTTSSLVLLLALVAGGLAAPFGSETPRCSTECPITRSPKLAYEPGKTYTYEYSGNSEVHLRGIEGGTTDLEWNKKVELTWITPCDVAISIKDAKVEGQTGPDMREYLERYPLVVAFVDGRVEHVCAHPGDAPWSINMKKGIATALQNSLPTLSPLTSGLTLTETDVVGKCPTKYEVETEGEKVIVVKEKNHRHCHERFPTAAETPAPWMKTPLPIEESRSECKQEIANGIYTTITCEDKNIVRPAFGLYKYVEANQESRLRFISEARETSAIRAIAGEELEIQSLLYNHETTEDPKVASEVDELMKEICEKTEDTVEADAAALVAKALHLLRHAPAAIVEEVVEKVRGGHYCRDSTRLESLFLDAVAFLHESGAVKIMVHEIENERATGGRLALYTAALYLTPRPNIEAVEALTPLFESSHPMPAVMLAAASMVNKYCQHTPECHEEAPVKRIAEILATKVERHCSPSAGEEAKEEVTAILKALGNMGIETPEVRRAALKCIEEEEIETGIRVAAAHVFRQTKCKREVTERLGEIAINPAKPTEVRIAAYLGAVRCAEEEDLEKIIPKIVEEENTQVRGFILSHLLNIQESESPDRARLRYLLSDYVIPRDFGADIRTHSRNIEMSYFSPSFGLGAGIESNVIYTPESFLPRSVDVNLRTIIENIPINLGEAGIRFEGFDEILEETFGPKGYLQETPFEDILRKLTSFAEEKTERIAEHLENRIRERRSIGESVIKGFFKKLYGEEKQGEVKADVFARIFGHEVTYASIAENLKELDADRIIESVFSAVDDILPTIANLDIDTARTGQLFLDYSLPTIQGTPLKLKLEGTAVMGLKLEGDLNVYEFITSSSRAEKSLKLIPSISAEVKGFAGFDCNIAKVGAEMKGTIASATGATIHIRKSKANVFEAELELPEKMELLSIKGESFLVKAVENRETRVIPPSVRDVRIKRESCIEALEPVLGLKMCYKVNLPDVFRCNALPLGEPIEAKMFVEKADPAMKGYLITAAIKNKKGNKMLKLNLDAPGAATPREVEMTLSYAEEEESHIISAKINAPEVAAGIWTTATNGPEYKALETFVKFESHAIDISRSFKVDFSAKEEGPETVFEANIFSGRNRRFTPETHIVETKFIKKDNGPEINVEVVCNTKNALAEYFELNFEVNSDLDFLPYAPIPLPTKLHKLEFYTGAGDWKINSFIRKTSETGDEVEHNAVFKIKNENGEILAFEGVTKVKGRTMLNVIIENEVSAKFGEESYVASYNVFLKPLKIGTKVEVTKQKENKKMIEFEALYERSGDAHNIKILADAPEYMRAMKFETKVVEEEIGKYALEAALKHGPSILLQVDGPVTAIFTPRKLKIDAALKFAVLDMEPHIISTTIFTNDKKQILAFEMKNRQETLIDLRWELNGEGGSRGKTITATKLNVLALFEFQMDTNVRPENIHVSFNTALLPKSASTRRIKAFADIDAENKKINAELAWDAGVDASKKIAVDAILINSTPDFSRAVIHGNIIVTGEQYHTKINLKAEDLLDSGFEIEITTPSQKTIALEANYKIENEGPTTEVVAKYRYKNIEDEERKFEGSFSVEKLEGPLSYAAEAKVHYAEPEGKESKFETVFKHHDKPEECELLFRANAEGFFLRKPLTVEFSMEKEEDSFEGKCKMERETPVSIFDWDIKMGPEGEIKNIEAGFDLKALTSLLKVLRSVASFERERRIEGHESSPFRYQYSQPTPTSHTMLLITPWRTMEGEAHLSAQESRVKFIPNRAYSMASYEAGYKASHEHGRSQWETIVNHPTLARPLQVAVQYSANERTVKGAMELDIFPEGEDKITGAMESTRLTENTVRTEISIESRILKASPKVILTTAIASDTLAFDVEVKKTPIGPPMIKAFAKYDKTTPRHAVVAAKMEFNESPLFELSGTINPVETPRCDGLAFSAAAYTPVLGKYDVHSKFCKPAFVQVTVRKEGETKELIARIGLQDPYNAGIGLSEGSTESEEERALVLARLQMVDPEVINVDMAYEREDIFRLKEEAFSTLMEIMDSAESEVKEILEDLTEGRLESIPAPELMSLTREAVREMKMIYVELMEEGVAPIMRNVPSFGKVRSGFKAVARVWAQVDRQILRQRERMLRVCFEMVKDTSDKVFAIMQETIEMVSTGELSGTLHEIIEAAEESELFKILTRNINTVLDEFPEEYEALKYVFFNVKETLERDVDLLLERAMEIPAVERFVNWIMENLNPDRFSAESAEDLAEALLEDFHVIALKTEGNQVKLEIPLQKPLYSVVQFLKKHVRLSEDLRDIMWVLEASLPSTMDDLIWMYYTFVPHSLTDLLPPFPRTAMVVGGTEVLTFDGLVLRAPRSPCKVLLAAHGSHRILMSHPEPIAAPELELRTPEATVVIKPDLEVLVDGRRMRRPEETLGELRIKDQEGRIEVECPLLKVVVEKEGQVVAVKASGWTFGRVAGLLGPNNIEVEDDRLTPSGEEASDAHELVAAWQEDHQCPTPTVALARPSVARMIQCEAILLSRSKCGVIVNPEPFIEMCHAAREACDVARAYRTMCAFKGISEPELVPC